MSRCSPNYLYLVKYSLFILGVGFLAFMVGFSIALELKKVLIIIAGLLLGGALLAISTRKVVISLFLISFFIVGQLIYFLKIQQASWIPFGLSLILYLKVLSVYSSDPYMHVRSSAMVMPAVIVFFILILLSSILNTVPILQMIVGFKNSIFIWSIFFLIAFAAVSLEFIDTLWDGMKWLILFQLPIVLYQALIVVPGRIASGGEDITHWDSIVGGFGGSPLGGGASSSLSLFVVIGMVYFYLLLRNDLMSRKFFWFMILVSLLLLALAEVKVIFITIPLAFILLNRKMIVARPFYFITGTFFLFIVLSSIFMSYMYKKSETTNTSIDIEHYFDEVFSAQFDPYNVRESTGEIGRLTSIVHWWSETGLDKPDKMLFGYGPGATRMSALSIGEVASKYYYYTNIARATSAQILWEFGLLGFLVFLYILIRAAYLLYKYINHKVFSIKQRVILETSFISLVLLIVTVPHNRDILEIPAVSLFAVFLIGYSVFVTKYAADFDKKSEQVSCE